jgi:GTP-binding protein HflX
MSEVTDIAKSAGYEVADQITQHRDIIDSAYYVGEGKLDEIQKTIKKESIGTVIFAGQLSAGQVFRIKRRLGDILVLDRNLLILEIFEKRSATTEARLQIALARLRYTFSWARESVRMHGIVSEQMGRGGPGQYPYEVNEAITRKRISKIEHQLHDVRQKQSNLRQHRGKSGFRIVALTGYTQSGKTTLFNNLASESKETGLGPFTTLSTLARKIDTRSKGKATPPVIMIDSIGFIEDLNPLLLQAFHTTLNELANSDLILLFVDASDDTETLIRKISTSQEVMRQELSGVPVLICINKVDIVTEARLTEVVQETRRIFATEEILPISSKTGANIPNLLERIGERLT